MRWRHSVFFTHGACRMMSKDVRTLYRFRFIYYLFKQDKAKYFEVIKVLFRNEFYGDHRTVHYILSKSPALTGDYRIQTDPPVFSISPLFLPDLMNYIGSYFEIHFSVLPVIKKMFKSIISPFMPSEQHTGSFDEVVSVKIIALPHVLGSVAKSNQMNQGSHQTICSVVGLHPILLISGGGDWYDTVCLLEVMTTTTVSSTHAALFHSLFGTGLVVGQMCPSYI